MVRAVTKKLDRPLDLAVVINKELAKFEATIRTGLEHARCAGEHLIKAKAQVGHTNWLDWVEEHLKCSSRSAEDYMRIAKHWTTIQAKSQDIANLTLAQALELISTKRRKKPKLQAPATEQESGADGQLDYEFEGDDIASTDDEGGKIKMATIAPGTETKPDGKVIESLTKVVHFLERLADSAKSLTDQQEEVAVLVRDARKALDKIEEVLA